MMKAQVMSIKIREARAQKVIDELTEVNNRFKSLGNVREMLETKKKNLETEITGY